MEKWSFSKDVSFEEVYDFFWQALNESTPLLAISQQGRILYASKPYYAITRSGEVSDQMFTDLIEIKRHHAGIQQEILNQIQSGKSWKRQLWLKTKGSHAICFKAAFYPRPGSQPSMQHLLVLFTDNQAVEINGPDQVGKFSKLSSWAHDLRNPLNNISALGALLLDTPLNEQQIDFVRKLKQTSGVLSGMIDDMLHYCLNEKTDPKPFSKQFELKTTIKEFIQHFGDRADGKDTHTKGIKTIIETDDLLPHCVYGDQRRLNQIIIYLAEYLISKPETRLVKISALTEHLDNEKCEISFFVLGQFTAAEDQTFAAEENEEALEFAFEKAKYNIDLLNGKVLLEERNPRALYFHFVLNFGLLPPETTPLKKEEKVITPEPINETSKILIAEDVELNQLVMKHQLLKIGFEAHFASTGYNVLEMLQTERYDLILMDIQMPGLDGIQTIEAIRANKTKPYHNLPIIGISASIGPNARAKCIAAGANDFVPKPYDLPDLKDKINKLISECRTKINGDMKPNHTDSQMPENAKYYDLNYLEEVSDGDKEFSATLISYFVENTPNVLTSLKNETQNQNWEQVKQIAHKFKTQVTYMGIFQISEVVEQVEQNAHKRENLEQIWPWVQNIEKICLLAIEQLKDELHKMQES